MFQGDQSHANQVAFKLKQYVDATYDVLRTQGSASKKKEHEEAHLWREELGQEIEALTNE